MYINLRLDRPWYKKSNLNFDPVLSLKISILYQLLNSFCTFLDLVQNRIILFIFGPYFDINNIFMHILKRIFSPWDKYETPQILTMG